MDDLTTIWPGVTELITSTPTARTRTRSMKARATSIPTSAYQQGAPHLAQGRIDVGSRERAARVRRSRMPDSFSDRESNIANTFAPEGATRCRAGASGLWNRSAIETSHLLRERAEPRDGCRASQV